MFIVKLLHNHINVTRNKFKYSKAQVFLFLKVTSKGIFIRVLIKY